MISTDTGSRARGDPWSAFFATSWSWLAHAAIWAGGMLAVNSILAVIHLAGPVSALAAVGATVTAYLSPAQREISLLEAMRFALVDAIFLGLAAGLLFPLLWLLLRLAGWSWGLDPIPISLSATVAVFVVQFYGFLWGALALRKRYLHWRHVPLGVACLAGAALAWSVWQQAAEHLAFRQEVVHKQAAYEAETGKPADRVKSQIALSLHGFYGRPVDLSVDQQGRLTVVGEFSFYAGHEVRGVSRLNHDGSLDSTRQSARLDPGVLAGPSRLRPLASGAMLIDVPQSPSMFSSPLVLLTLRPDGEIDQRPAVTVGTWSANVYERHRAPFDVQADGRILVGRYGALEPGATSACLQRYLADGTLDTAFDTAVGDSLDSRIARPARDCAVTDVVALPDGKIMVRLSRRDEQGVWREEQLRRLHADGRVDEGFQPELVGVRHVAAGLKGELIATTLVGSATPPAFSLWKLRDDGTPDPAFSTAAGSFAVVDALATQGDGKLLVGGRRPGDALDLGLFRLLPDGRLDSSFGKDGRVAVNGFIHRVVVTPAGQIYLLGDFLDVGTGADRLPRYQIARLHYDGTPDPTFDPQ